MSPDSHRRPTQVQLILDYMQRYGSISSLQAFTDLGVTRLAARMLEIKKQGIGINRQLTSVTSPVTGITVTFAVYSLSPAHAATH